MTKFIKKNAGVGLTILGTLGMVATIVCSIKATKKTQNDISQKELDKMSNGEIAELTLKEKSKIIIPNYSLMLGFGFGSLACFWGSAILSKKKQTSLIKSSSCLLSIKTGLAIILKVFLQISHFLL